MLEMSIQLDLEQNIHTDRQTDRQTRPKTIPRRIRSHTEKNNENEKKDHGKINKSQVGEMTFAWKTFLFKLCRETPKKEYNCAVFDNNKTLLSYYWMTINILTIVTRNVYLNPHMPIWSQMTTTLVNCTANDASCRKTPDRSRGCLVVTD